MWRLLFLYYLILLCSATSYAESALDRAKKDEIVFMQDQEPAMLSAFQRARTTLEDFLAKAKAPVSGTVGYSLKVGITQENNTEYFWVGDFKQTESGFSGIINNDPRMVKNIRLGQVYNFPKEHIVDWTYFDRNENRMIGNFTLCALLTKEPPKEAEVLKKRFGLICD
jgi:uncharacterized protein YegJ (DUF2314 family)